MKQQDPWLSVLMPVYNGAQTLAESLSSIAVQSDGVEVILVDQASADGSAELAKQFEGQLDIKVISHPESTGWIENTNLAMQYARAPFSTYLHQDDFWYPGRVALLEHMRTAYPTAELWAHGADYVDLQGRVIGRFSPPLGPEERLVETGEALSRLLVQNTLALPAAMFRTATLKEIDGLDTSLPMTADWDLWLRLIRKGGMAWAPARKAAFRLHLGSQTLKITSNYKIYEEQLGVPIARHIEAIDPAMRARTEAHAQASRRLNLLLASRYHGHMVSVRDFLQQFIALGPLQWIPFLRDTQVFQRVIPRLKLMMKKSI